jgi:hypothetical protein
MPLTVSEWLAEYRRAWIERDPDAAAALFTEYALYREQPYDEPFVGPSRVRDYWARVTATQEAVELEYGTPIVDGDRVAVEWWVTMVNGGAEITLAGSFMLKFDDSGLCRELREYWHVGEGRQSPPAGWGT